MYKEEDGEGQAADKPQAGRMRKSARGFGKKLKVNSGCGRIE